VPTDATHLLYFVGGKMSKKGITQIKIPIKLSDLTIEVIEKYLPTVFAEFEKNSTQITSDYNKYCLDLPILSKERAHDDTDVNNIVIIPSLKSFVDWKTGYVFGFPIKYVQTKTNETDDITYLAKYRRNTKQRYVDREVGKWAYISGVGYYFIEPKSEKYNINSEAPYVLYCREADTCFKVYSSFTGNEPLFDVLYTTYEEIDDKKQKNKVSVLDVYTHSTLYHFEKRKDRSGWINTKSDTRGISKPLPLVEKRLNSDGIGLVAMGESLQDSLDNLISNALDNVEDMVNEIYVYKNVNLGDTPEKQAANHKAMKKNGAVVLNTPSGSSNPADLDTVSPKMSLKEVTDLFDVINTIFHATLGVPMEVSNTNSGGTTKSGSEVSNGYDNAYNRALDDINSFEFADTDLLEKIMWICENSVGNPINNLDSSDIEIKYSLNLTDNILTKTQSYVNLVQSGVPATIALRICKLSNDAEAEGKLIEDNIKAQKALANLTTIQ
jgi:SPP1 family phage portal protein